MRKRNRMVSIRYTNEEYEQLLQKVKESGQTQQSYLLRSSLGAIISPRMEIEEMKRKNQILQDLDKQLRGMATNLNQLAHVANGYGEIPATNKLLSILSEVQKLRSEVNREWQLTRQSISEQKLTEL